ncbi:DUF6493 family protein [Actinomadura rubrisoli]|uniref:DUF7824 domain-containing protein n=1 Tax=Actinomadura rubrisoli TaxID=2530368 RepID=A0A4R5A6H7_9ACTN|nr:DUF6493 family protein [Actinomadura rubrisoli]TDD67718.1 hypothetical protein E1298_39090 [Actinomadura rubrisoli]
MHTWPDIRAKIDAGDLPAVTSMLVELPRPERRAVAKELPGRLKEMRAAAVLSDEVTRPLLVAGAGTIGGAAEAAAWLCRTDLRLGWDANRYADLCSAICAVTADRPAKWRGDVASRVARRLVVGDQAGRTPQLWHIAAALTLAAEAAPPVSDGFVVGWLADDVHPMTLAEDPFLDALVPRLFSAIGVGAALARDAGRGEQGMAQEGAQYTWAGSLAALARAGRLDPAALLDGCLSRFLLGGTAHTLRWFVRLHDALEPTDEEVAARVRDYVRLLPAAPPNVADLALRAIRRADDMGRLDEALFEEAAGALLFRPEKKLVRATLIWLDRTAGKRERVDATLRAVTAVFDSDAIETQERAAKIAAKHMGKAGKQVRAEVLSAAAPLPPDLLEPITATSAPSDTGAKEGRRDTSSESAPDDDAAFGGSGLSAASRTRGASGGVSLSDGPPPFRPRELPPPIGSPAEMAEEFPGRGARTWADTERFLAALVELSFRDFAGTTEALGRIVQETAPGLTQAAESRYHDDTDGVALAVRALFVVRRPRWFHSALASFRRSRSRARGRSSHPPIHQFLAWRMQEAASLVGKVPVLLATATSASGHVDPGVLVDRIGRYEEAGADPGAADLLQALLRVPREIDPAAVARAQGLGSKAGRAVASWLAGGGLADPAVECEIVKESVVRRHGRDVHPPNGVLSVVATGGDAPSDVSRLCDLPLDTSWKDLPYYHGPTAWWPPTLPSHREVVAAHLLPYAAGSTDDAWAGQAPILWGEELPVVAVAEADGPAGAATGALLAYALASPRPEQRANAVDALLVLSGRGHLPAAEFGDAFGRLTALRRVKLTRIVKGLGDAADAGAHADIWTAIAAALPHVLPEADGPTPSGVHDLIALGTRTARASEARAAIPALEAVAGRGGTSRLVKEAARLHRTLTTP